MSKRTPTLVLRMPRRYKLVRVSAGTVETLDYIGPYKGWPRDWSMQCVYALSYKRAA